MRYAVRFTVIAFLTMLLTACGQVSAQRADGTFSRTFDVPTPLELEVSTGSGSITIRAGSRSEVEVIGHVRVHGGSFFFSRSDANADEIVRALEADPPIELDGNRLRVGRIDDSGLRRNVSISYEITVPAETSGRSRTGSGSQRVSGLAAATAETGSGRIELTDIRGDVQASTGSGSIQAEGIAGAFRGRTGSGSVTLEQTVSESIDVSTGSGSVRVRVPAGAAFDVDAHTGSGGISTAYPINVSGRIERNSLRGSAGSGGPPIRIRTGSGSVRIE